MRHSLEEEDIDALAAAAHGFVSADLAAVCDEAAMAALRRIIASRQHPSADPPTSHPQAQASHGPLSPQHPAWSDSELLADDQHISSHNVQLSATEHAQQADTVPEKGSQSGDAQDYGVAGSSGDLLSGSLQHSDDRSLHAATADDVQGSTPDASCEYAWQVQHCVIALAQGSSVWPTLFANKGLCLILIDEQRHHMCWNMPSRLCLL